MRRDDLENHLRHIWERRVAGEFMYRAMNLYDLTYPLDPSADPFAQIRSSLLLLLDGLDSAISRGLNFRVHEDYSGMSFELSDILNWSRRDLCERGIDFTSSHASAEGYSMNFQGSQLRQNFRYITQYMLSQRANSAVAAYLSQTDWAMATQVHDWIVEPREHKRAIIWVSRASAVFDTVSDHLYLGSFERFLDRALLPLETLGQLAHSEANGSPGARDFPGSEVFAEPEEFCVRLTAPLHACEISKVEVLQ